MPTATLIYNPHTATTLLDDGTVVPEPHGPDDVARHAQLLTNLGYAVTIRVVRPKAFIR